MSQFAWTFPGGKPKQEVTSITLVNNTEKMEDIAVPTGKIWILLCIKIRNSDDVDRSCSIFVYKEAAKTNVVKVLYNTIIAATERGHWPNTSTTKATKNIPSNPAEMLLGGNKISITWAAGGASAGAVDADGLVIEYLEIDAP